MAHKAPTAVTVAPVQEKTGFALWISRHWLHGTVIALAIAAAIIIRDQMEGAKVSERSGSWEKLSTKLSLDRQSGLLQGDATTAAALAIELKDTVAGPSARLAEARLKLKERDYAGAGAALDALEREYPKHHYVTDTFKFGDKSETLVSSMRASIAALKGFDEAHPEFQSNPPPAPDAPRVKLTTDKGVIVVALYVQQAPKHCENFLKLCREGFYAGTKFHRSVPHFMIQGGDPNSKAGEPATWGLGGPGYKVDSESTNGLFHFAGSLAMAKSGGDVQSSGSQFYITTDPRPDLDGQYTVFGTVVEGMDVVRAINEQPNSPDAPERPATPAVLLSAEVL